MPKKAGRRVSDVLRRAGDVAGLTLDGYAPPSPAGHPAGPRPEVCQGSFQADGHSSMDRPRLFRAVQSRIRCG